MDDETPPEIPPPPSEEWIQEAERRLAAYERGEMKAFPWPEVKKRVLRATGLDDSKF